MILYLSINDLFQAFLHGTDHAYNLGHGYVVPGRTCQAAGWWIGEFLVGNICWMIALVYYLHKVSVSFFPRVLLKVITKCCCSSTDDCPTKEVSSSRVVASIDMLGPPYVSHLPFDSIPQPVVWSKRKLVLH